MIHGRRFLVGALVTVVLALALLAAGGQGAQAQGDIIYVDVNAGGANDGTSWEDAFLELQSALDVAASGDQVWVAAGSYKPTAQHGGTGERYRSFQLLNGVAIYGGFNPEAGDIGWEDRDWANNVTILSGDIGIDGDSSDNSYHVFYHPPELGLEGTAILDGFTVTGGNANGNYPHWMGGGMFNYQSSPALANCIFDSNLADAGGGMANYASSAPTLANCTFTGNTADWGGGMGNHSSSSPILINCNFQGNTAVGSLKSGGGMANFFSSSPMLTDCTFEGNGTAWDGSGGGMYNYYASSPMLTNVTFEGNWASYGGGMANYNSAAPTLTGCTFSNNLTGIGRGGGMYNRESSAPTLDNCTFMGNSALRGGGMLNYDRSSPTLTNCAFSGNQSGQEGGGMYNYGLSSPTLTSVNFEGNSAGSFGGGMYNVIESSPTLTDCNFSDNSANIRGGGMHNRESSAPTLSACAFTGNMAVEDGGGIYNEESSPTLNNCAFANNLAYNSGGGMYNDTSAPALSGCTFLNNSADSGAGMYNVGSWPVLTGCTFLGNSANSGGGMYNHSFSSPTMTNCTFEGNLADLKGGGMLNYSSSPMLTNCRFSDNESASAGGGMSNVEASAPLLINCTFEGNSAKGGGGMHNDGFSSPTLTNCTFWGNDAGSGGGVSDAWSSPVLTNCILWDNSPDQIADDANSSPVVTYSDVQGGYPGTGNIDADPLFLNASNGDFHLGIGSPCIDVGNNAAPDLPLRDFEGDPRILDGDGNGTAVVDMGVDEAWGPPPPVIYVDQVATGTNSGTSWADAFTDLQDALTWAIGGVEIWVAEGTYKPSVEHGGTGDRFQSFQMVNGVGIYGGFDPSVGDDTWEDRDWVNNLTILSGDLNGDDGPDFANNDENSYHVLFHSWEMELDSSAILDGFTITGGNANLAPDDGLNNRGGGMGNFGASPTVANCTFRGTRPRTAAVACSTTLRLRW